MLRDGFRRIPNVWYSGLSRDRAVILSHSIEVNERSFCLMDTRIIALESIFNRELLIFTRLSQLFLPSY